MLLLLAAPALALLFATTLDFLMARAIGALLLLASTTLLDIAFAENIPLRPFFAVFGYLAAVPGFVFVVAPWLSRDLLEWSLKSTTRRMVVTATAGSIGLVFIGYALACRHLAS